MRAIMITLLPALLLAACSDGGLTEEEKACRDFADAFADLCERCEPGTYYECYDAVVDGVGGDCAEVQAIRDMDEFYNECIPWLRAEDCANLTDEWALDDSCIEQLLI